MKTKIILLSTILLLGVLFIFHLRHPFYYYEDGDDMWSVATGVMDSDSVIVPQTVISYESIDSITPTGFIADPFFIKNDSLFYLFVEHLINSKGAVSYFVSDDFVNWEFKGVVIDEPFHMSYPQVFKDDDGDIYMLPEAGRSKNILLYKAVSFPDKWVVSDTLVANIRIKDPSLIKKDNHYYIFCVDRKHVQRVFVSDNLHTGWHEHVNSPIGIGNNKRPGGRFIVKDDQYFLPVQNSDEDYGTAVFLTEVLELSPTNITISKDEKPFLESFPSHKYLYAGVHHIDLQKIDGRHYYVFDGRGSKKEGKFVLQVRSSIVKNVFDLLDFMGVYRVPSFLY